MEVPWSLSVWVKRTANRSTQTLLSARDELGRYRYIYLETGSAEPGRFPHPRRQHPHLRSHTVALNTWTHLALVATSGETRLYVNGTLAGTVADSMTLPFDAIAALRSANGLRAKLDDFKIWDEALSAAQVAADYRSRCANSGLVHHWALDETSGTTATDAGSGDDDGTITGASRVAQGRLGGALSFDGNSDYIQVGADAIGVTGTCGGWTAALWVRRTAAQTWTALLGSGLGSGWEVRLAQGDGKVGISNITNTDDSFDHTPAVNTWEHLTLVGTAGATTLYVNGALVGTINRGFALPLGRIGGSASGAWINAALDDIRVYGSALTAVEVAALYGELNVSPPPDPPGEVTLSPASTQLTVRWSAPEDDGGAAVSGYVVAHKLASASAWSAPTALGAAATSHVIPNLTDATAYEVRVAARSAPAPCSPS